MKKLVFIMAGLSLVLSSCRKNTGNQNRPQTSASLTVLTEYISGGSTSIEVDPQILAANCYLDITANGVLLNLAGNSITASHTRHGLSLIFKEAQTFPEATGAYDFPIDNNIVRSALRTEVNIITTEYLLEPVDGRVVIKYYPSTGTMNGRIENLEYRYSLNDPYGRARVVINGEFYNVSRK